MRPDSTSCQPIARAAQQPAGTDFWRGLLTALIVVSPLLLGGCLVQSKVQGRYVEDQGQCRDSAEGNITAVQAPSDTAKDRNTKLVTLFANCMAKKGWQVARPKTKPRPPTTNGPHGPLDPYGSAVRTTTTTTTTGPVNQPGAAAKPQQPGAQPQPQYYQQQTTTTTTGPAQQPGQRPYNYQQPATQYPVGQRPVQTTTTPLSPSGSMPPLAQPSDTGPAYYQPGRNYTAPTTTPYGGGAGRNF